MAKISELEATVCLENCTTDKALKKKIKINASNHKSQIGISPKPSRFSKNFLTKSFLEFYLAHNPFYLKLLQ